MDPPADGAPVRTKRVQKMSPAMRESLEAAKSLKTATGEDNRLPSRRIAKTESEASRGGAATSTPSKSKGSSSKSSGSGSLPVQTPPTATRSMRSSTPTPGASSTSTAPAPPNPLLPPPHTDRAPPPPVQWWVTSPNPPAGVPVFFYPAHQPPHMAPSAYSYSAQPAAPVSNPQPTLNSSSMDVTEQKETIPTPAPTMVAPTLSSSRTPLTRLQQQYNGDTVISFKSGHAMSSSIRQQVSVPAYTTSQIRQVQSQPITQSELGSLNFTPHVKKNLSAPGNFASAGRVFVIDNGAYAAKLGFASSTHPDVIHNMIGKPKAAKRKFVGAELGTVHGAYVSATKPSFAVSAGTKGDSATCNDFRALSITRPHDRGYVLNWDLQAQIWALHELFRRKYPITTSKKTTSSQHAAMVSNDPSDIFEASSHCLIVTEAHLAPWNLRQKLFEFVFGSAKFGSLFVCSSAYLSMLHHRYVQKYIDGHGKVYVDAGEHTSTASLPSPAQNPCCVIVDVGYSFTHVTPFFEEAKMNYAIRRLNIGGKVMTNLLRELVSFRYFNMMDQTYLISLVKERLCYVSTDFRGDLKKSRLKKNAIRRHYVLPDQTNSILGYVYGTTPTAEDLGRAVTEVEVPVPPSSSMEIDGPSNEGSASAKAPTQQKQLALPEDSQVLPLGNERFSVPEVLFHPSDVGLRQAGLGEVVLQSIMACPEYLREAMCANIVLVGASAAIPGLPERLLQELRPLLPTSYVVRIHISNVPGNTSWLGGKYLATQKPDLLDSMAVSLQEYHEHGPNLPKHRFALF